MPFAAILILIGIAFMHKWQLNLDECEAEPDDPASCRIFIVSLDGCSVVALDTRWLEDCPVLELVILSEIQARPARLPSPESG